MHLNCACVCSERAARIHAGVMPATRRARSIRAPGKVRHAILYARRRNACFPARSCTGCAPRSVRPPGSGYCVHCCTGHRRTPQIRSPCGAGLDKGESQRSERRGGHHYGSARGRDVSAVGQPGARVHAGVPGLLGLVREEMHEEDARLWCPAVPTGFLCRRGGVVPKGGQPRSSRP